MLRVRIICRESDRDYRLRNVKQDVVLRDKESVDETVPRSDCDRIETSLGENGDYTKDDRRHDERDLVEYGARLPFPPAEIIQQEQDSHERYAHTFREQ